MEERIEGGEKKEAEGREVNWRYDWNRKLEKEANRREVSRRKRWNEERERGGRMKKW